MSNSGGRTGCVDHLGFFTNNQTRWILQLSAGYSHSLTRLTKRFSDSCASANSLDLGCRLIADP